MIILWKRTDWPESLSFSLREGQQYGIIKKQVRLIYNFKSSDRFMSKKKK